MSWKSFNNSLYTHDKNEIYCIYLQLHSRVVYRMMNNMLIYMLCDMFRLGNIVLKRSKFGFVIQVAVITSIEKEC